MKRYNLNKRFSGSSDKKNRQREIRRYNSIPNTISKPPVVTPLGQPVEIEKHKNFRIFNNWGVIAVVCLILSTLITYSALLNLSDGNILGLFGTPGIKANMDEIITGYTISDIPNLIFSVKNKSAKDVSVDTIWYLNNTPINYGTNETYLDIEGLNWGDNYVTAQNGEDTITYVLKLDREYNSNDTLHTMMSLSESYDESWYNTGEIFSETDNETLKTLALQKKGNLDYGNGTIKTIQEYRDGLIILETTESVAYSLNMGDPIEISKDFAGDYVVEVSGSWDYVESANLCFDLQGKSKDDFIAVTYKNNKVNTIPKDSQYYSNGKIIVAITSPGVYMLRPSNLDNGNLNIRYDIAILNIGETDIIRSSQLESKPELYPGDSSKVLSNSYYEENLDALINDAKSMTKLDMEYNILTWNNKTAMLEKDGSKYIRDYSASSIEESLLTLLDYKQDNIYKKLGLIVIDASNSTTSQLKDIADLISSLSRFELYDMKYVIIGSSINNIRALTDMPENTVIYELDSLDELNSYISTINSWLSSGNNETIEVIASDGKATEKNVVKLVDTQFDIEAYGITSSNKVSPYTSFGNSFGQALLSKLAFEKALKSEFIESSDCIMDTNTDVDLSKLNLPSVGLVIPSSDIDNINSGDYNKVDQQNIDNIINMLDLAKYNSKPFMNLSSIPQNNSSTNIIEYIVNGLNDNGPILAMVGGGFGDIAVLITAISQDINDESIFYIHMYNPLIPEKEEIAQLEIFRGISSTNNIGYGYRLDYKCNGIILNRMSLVTEINIAKDEEVVYMNSLEGKK